MAINLLSIPLWIGSKSLLRSTYDLLQHEIMYKHSILQGYSLSTSMQIWIFDMDCLLNKRLSEDKQLYTRKASRVWFIGTNEHDRERIQEDPENDEKNLEARIEKQKILRAYVNLCQSLFFLRRIHIDVPRFFNEDWTSLDVRLYQSLFLTAMPITLFPEKDA